MSADELPLAVLPGMSVQRLPQGRICRVVACDGTTVLISDPGIWRGRVTLKAFRKRWRVMGQGNDGER